MEYINMIFKCIICEESHNTNQISLSFILSEFFILNYEYQTPDQLKLISLFKNHYDLFCKNCIIYGLLRTEEDNDRRNYRYLSLLRRIK